MWSRKLLLYGVALVLVGAIGAYLYLFRQVTTDNPALGVIVYRYRWARPYEIRADSNRDGAYDLRALVHGEPSFSTHTVPSELWEDRDFDGVFETHALLEAGEIMRLEIDDDQDGTYDRTLTGAEAAATYQGFAAEKVPDEMSRSVSLLWQSAG